MFDLIEYDNILIKSGVHVSNPFNYIAVSDNSGLIKEQLKKYDFKRLFGRPLVASKLSTIEGENKSTKENFLKKKTRRAVVSKDIER